MRLLENRKIVIKTLSPIHIKGKDIDYGQGFLKRDTFTAYAIDSNKLAEYLYNLKGDFSLVEQYAEDIEKKTRNFSNVDFFKRHGIYHYPNNRRNETELIEKGVFKNVVNATPATYFIRNGLANPFIPGSSLKGAIRTAVMYHIAKTMIKNGDKNKVVDFINNLNLKIDRFEERNKGKSKRQIDRAKATFSQELQYIIFQGQSRLAPHKDFMRSIKIKDSLLLNGLTEKRAVLLTLTTEEKARHDEVKENISLDNKVGTLIQRGEGIVVEFNGKEYDFKNRIYNKNFFELKKNVGKKIRIMESGGHKIKSYKILSEEGKKETKTEEKNDEYVKKNYKINYKFKPTNVPTDFNVETFQGSTEMLITIDHSILKERKSEIADIPFASIEELFQLVAEFGKELWQFEKEFWENCTDNQLNVATIRNFYSQRPKNVMRIGWGPGLMGMTIDMLLKKDKQKELRNRLFTNRGDMPAPKSRRVIEENGEPSFPLGWVEFKILER